MPISAATETTITYSELQDLRTVLITVHTCLSARDLSDSAANTLGEVRYRPLTRDVERLVTRVKGMLGDLLMDNLDEPEEIEESEEPDAEVEVEEYEQLELPLDQIDPNWLEELSENPLGSKKITPHVSTFFDDGDEGDDV